MLVSVDIVLRSVDRARNDNKSVQIWFWKLVLMTRGCELEDGSILTNVSVKGSIYRKMMVWKRMERNIGSERQHPIV